MPLSEALRSLPYKVHTNSELGLMLRGVKPLAIFSDGYLGDNYEGFPDVVARYLRCFDRLVREGRFAKREFVVLTFLPHLHNVRGVHRIYYTLPGEEWRVDAMMALMARPDPWCAEREREFGRLLGYTAWEADVWARAFPITSG